MCIRDSSSPALWAEFQRRYHVEPVVADCGGDSLESAGTRAREFIFGRAIPVTGLLHVLDNLTDDVHATMEGWGPFIDQLNALSRLLCRPENVERFVQNCLRQGGHAQYVHLFTRAFPPIAEWRWGTLLRTLEWLLPLEAVLRRAWDPDTFGRGGDDLELDK
eukprot:1893320-Alexandrium_andersonii.AAC.1